MFFYLDHNFKYIITLIISNMGNVFVYICLYLAIFSVKLNHTRYISTGGTVSNSQLELIETAMAKMTKIGGEIVIATDNDMAGNKLFQTLSKKAPLQSNITRDVPKQGKDWNELLQQTRQREYLRQKQNRSRGLEL